MITKPEQFTGLIHIPNLDGEELEELNRYIDQYEPEYLRRFLGDELYEQYEGDPTAPPFDDLEKWLNTEPYPIAHYIFVKYYSHRLTFNTGLGEVRPNAENAAVIDGNARVSEAWNVMVKATWKVAILWHENGYPSPSPDPFMFERDNPLF